MSSPFAFPSPSGSTSFRPSPLPPQPPRTFLQPNQPQPHASSSSIGPPRSITGPGSIGNPPSTSAYNAGLTRSGFVPSGAGAGAAGGGTVYGGTSVGIGGLGYGISTENVEKGLKGMLEGVEKLEGLLKEVMEGVDNAFQPGIDPGNTEAKYNEAITLLKSLISTATTTSVGGIPIPLTSTLANPDPTSTAQPAEQKIDLHALSQMISQGSNRTYLMSDGLRRVSAGVGQVLGREKV